MRFLIDADLPRDTAILLASFGHVAFDVRDVGMRHAQDPEIAAYALQNQLCILTGDWGFSDVRVYPPEQYFGIVVIGLPARATGPTILGAIRRFLERPDLVALLPHRLAIVEKNRVRLRPPHHNIRKSANDFPRIPSRRLIKYPRRSGQFRFKYGRDALR
ncbi:MAG TPA: DUF5615 family PIN-like protein [Humisphaera sp.]|jgi:hypothetical protein|nr:DUF5615 family PIN-like protein [Humisphaera sp.]